MTCIRDILNEEALEREFESIRKVFKTFKKEELPLRIEWGTKKAFEKQISERLRFLVKIVPKTAFPFEDFKSELDEIGELDEGHLEVKDVADGYEVIVDKDAWIRSYEERGCPLEEKDRTDMALAEMYVDEIKGMIATEAVTVTVEVKPIGKIGDD